MNQNNITLVTRIDHSVLIVALTSNCLAASENDLFRHSSSSYFHLPDNKVFSKSVLGLHRHLPFSYNQEGIFDSRCNHLKCVRWIKWILPFEFLSKFEDSFILWYFLWHRIGFKIDHILTSVFFDHHSC